MLEQTGANAVDAGAGEPAGNDAIAKLNRIQTSEMIGQLAKLVAPLGYEIVDVSGHLDEITHQATLTAEGIHELAGSAADVKRSAAEVRHAVTETLSSTEKASHATQSSRAQAAEASLAINALAGWAESAGVQFEELRDALTRMEKESEEIRRIAKEVHMLAINASIVAARAGEEGRAFTVVSNAINELSQSTSMTAERMTRSLQELKGQTGSMLTEGRNAHGQAVKVKEGVAAIDQAFASIEEIVSQIGSQTHDIEREAGTIDDSCETFVTSVREMEEATSISAGAVAKASERIMALIDLSEELVGLSANLGGSNDDSRFIDKVLEMSAAVSTAFERGIVEGQISEADLFDMRYEPIPDTNPQQLMAPYTRFTDSVLPPIQEEALKFDPKVIFCAAVDTNGYLPTHNLKFSHPQRDDPEWNAANCRNRRVFDDRVGLKAGQNRRRFLLQTYRRDMGGGRYVMMKDLSAPIIVRGRHWGGLRFAYGF